MKGVDNVKCEVIIGNVDEEKVIIYARERTPDIESIEDLVRSCGNEITGYYGNEIYRFPYAEADVYAVENGRIYAYLGSRKLAIRERLYEIEEIVGDVFVKINQSCIVKVSEIEKFESSFGGSVRVIIKNGYKDYISRRQLKSVKERIGFKI